MSFLTLNALFAVVVFAGVICRLAMLKPARPTLGARVTWLLWMWSHVLIGVGCFGIILGPVLGRPPAHGGSSMMLLGLALYFGLRWQREGSRR